MIWRGWVRETAAAPPTPCLGWDWPFWRMEGLVKWELALWVWVNWWADSLAQVWDYFQAPLQPWISPGFWVVVVLLEAEILHFLDPQLQNPLPVEKQKKLIKPSHEMRWGKPNHKSNCNWLEINFTAIEPKFPSPIMSRVRKMLYAITHRKKTIWRKERICPIWTQNHNYGNNWVFYSTTKPLYIIYTLQ